MFCGTCILWDNFGEKLGVSIFLILFLYFFIKSNRLFAEICVTVCNKINLRFLTFVSLSIFDRLANVCLILNVYQKE